MRSVRVIVMFVMMALSAIACQAASIEASVWPIQEDGRNICTATSINTERHLWLTAAHCVTPEEPAKGAKATGKHNHWWKLFQGEDAKAPAKLTILGEEVTVVMRDVVNDVAVVSTNRVTAPAVPLASVEPQTKDPVEVVGFPLGLGDPVTTIGIVSAPSQQLDPHEPRFTMFQVTGAPGNSGSAITNANGEIISILQVGWGRSFGPMVGGVRYAALATFAGYFEHGPDSGEIDISATLREWIKAIQ